MPTDSDSTETQSKSEENDDLKRLSQSLGMSMEAVKTMMSSAGGTSVAHSMSTPTGSSPYSFATRDMIANRGRKRSSISKPGGKSPLWTHFTRGVKMPGNNNYYRAYCNYCTPNAKEGDKFMEGRVRNLENHLKYCASYQEAVRRNCALALDGFGNSDDGETPIMYIKTLSDKAIIPVRPSPLSAGYELCSAESVRIPAGERAFVKTNLSISIPPGTYGRICCLSNTALQNNSIDIGHGVIDADYRDDVEVKIINYGSTDFQVSVGDKIALLILEKICIAEVEVVSHLTQGESSTIGTSGFDADRIVITTSNLEGNNDFPTITKDATTKKLKVENET